jgi:DNA-binding LytR/AlgR family response regulator
MIESLLVDDEAPARQHLARLLRAHSDVRVAGEAANGLEALQLVADRRPDAIFLDIEMPGLNGLDVARQLDGPPLIVFVTAYDQHAVNAFDVNAIDFLLKPIIPARLAKTLDRMRAALLRPSQDYGVAVRTALKMLEDGPPARLAVHRGNRVVLLSLKDILYAVAEDKLVFVCTSGERYLTNRTIADLESLLSRAGFFRISRSVLVNLEHARELLPWSSGTCRLKLSNSVELGVSRERSRELRARIA